MPVNIPITIACGDYDRTRAIKDGRVPIERVRRHLYPLKPEKIFFRAFRDLSGAPRPFRLGMASARGPHSRCLRRTIESP